LLWSILSSPQKIYPTIQIHVLPKILAKLHAEFNSEKWNSADSENTDLCSKNNISWQDIQYFAKYLTLIPHPENLNKIFFASSYYSFLSGSQIIKWLVYYEKQRQQMKNNSWGKQLPLRGCYNTQASRDQRTRTCGVLEQLLCDSRQVGK
jgi:hypothetical protein